MPKIHFPKFDGTNPKIWFDNCVNYFTIYSIPEELKVTAAVMYLEGNAAKWWQAYKQNHQIPTWPLFCNILQEKFGADDFRIAINELLALRQTGTVEEYTATFQALQYDITMHNNHYEELFFASKYVAGLKDEIRAVVEPHVPTIVDRAVVIARIQQRTIERNKKKYSRNYAPSKPAPPKTKPQTPQTTVNMQRIRPLRDYKGPKIFAMDVGRNMNQATRQCALKGNNPS